MTLTERYTNRRKNLVNQIDTGIILIDSSGFAPDPMLWDKNLCYLTGISDRNMYLLIVPNGVMVERLETRTGPELMQGRRVSEILFVPERSARDSFMDGAAAPLETLQKISGVDRIYPRNQLDTILGAALMDTDILWLNTPGIPPINEPPSPHIDYVNRIRERYYWIQHRNIAPQIHQMRFVKDDYEIASLREAFTIHSRIFQQIMRTIKPGNNESLIQAIFDYEIGTLDGNISSIIDERYQGSIIAGSGPNSAIPHYMDNNRVIEDGDLVLIDTGVSVNGYFSDITRTFPANGTFTPRQRELYAITLEALYAAIDTMKPGSTLLQMHQAVYDIFKKHNVAHFGYGNCGHPVGLSVHDPHGRYIDDREQPFQPGTVLVIEPFLIIPEEKMGIRIEDGILITETGHEILPGPPREIEEVEHLCQQ